MESALKRTDNMPPADSPQWLNSSTSNEHGGPQPQQKEPQPFEAQNYTTDDKSPNQVPLFDPGPFRRVCANSRVRWTTPTPPPRLYRTPSPRNSIQTQQWENTQNSPVLNPQGSERHIIHGHSPLGPGPLPTLNTAPSVSGRPRGCLTSSQLPQGGTRRPLQFPEGPDPLTQQRTYQQPYDRLVSTSFTRPNREQDLAGETPLSQIESYEFSSRMRTQRESSYGGEEPGIHEAQILFPRTLSQTPHFNSSLSGFASYSSQPHELGAEPSIQPPKSQFRGRQASEFKQEYTFTENPFHPSQQDHFAFDAGNTVPAIHIGSARPNYQIESQSRNGPTDGLSHIQSGFGDMSMEEMCRPPKQALAHRRAQNQATSKYDAGMRILNSDDYQLPPNINDYIKPASTTPTNPITIDLTTPPVNFRTIPQCGTPRPAAHALNASEMSRAEKRAVSKQAKATLERERDAALKIQEMEILGKRKREHDPLFEEDPTDELRNIKLVERAKLQKRRKFEKKVAQVIHKKGKETDEAIDQINAEMLLHEYHTKKRERAVEERLIQQRQEAERNDNRRENAAARISQSREQREKKKKAEIKEQKKAMQKELKDREKLFKAQEDLRKCAAQLKFGKENNMDKSGKPDYGRSDSVFEDEPQDSPSIFVDGKDSSAASQSESDASAPPSPKCQDSKAQDSQPSEHGPCCDTDRSLPKDPSNLQTDSASKANVNTDVCPSQLSSPARSPHLQYSKSTVTMAELRGRNSKTLIKEAEKARQSKEISDRIQIERREILKEISAEHNKEVCELRAMVAEMKKAQEKHLALQKRESEKKKLTQKADVERAGKAKAKEEATAAKRGREAEDIAFVYAPFQNHSFESSVRLEIDGVEQARKDREARDLIVRNYKNSLSSFLSKKRAGLKSFCKMYNIPLDEEKMNKDLAEEERKWQDKRKQRGAFNADDYARFQQDGSIQLSQDTLNLNVEEENISTQEGDSGGNKDPSFNQSTQERSQREAETNTHLASLRSRNSSSSDFAKAAAKRTVQDLQTSDESEESEEDPDPVPENAESEEDPDPEEREEKEVGSASKNLPLPSAANLIAPPHIAEVATIGKEILGCILQSDSHLVEPSMKKASQGTVDDSNPLEVTPAVDVIPSIDQPAQKSFWREESELNKGKTDTDMLWIYTVKSMRTEKEVEGTPINLQRFTSSEEANSFAQMEMLKHRFGENKPLVSRTETVDSENGLFIGEKQLDFQGGVTERVWVSKSLEFKGNLQNFDRAILINKLPVEAFSVIKLIRENGNAVAETIAVASTRLLANKLTFEHLDRTVREMLQDSPENIINYEAECLPGMQKLHREADESDRNLDVDMEVGECCIFVFTAGPHQVLGPLN